MKNTKILPIIVLIAVVISAFAICSFAVYADDSAPEAPTVVAGDVNGDKKVELQDVLLLRQYFAYYDYSNGISNVDICSGADFNENGTVELGDLVALRKYLANEDLSCAHQWLDATCEAPKTCSLCGETEGDALGHNTNGTVEHKDATCTENGVVGGTYCDVCNEGKEAAEKVIEAAGHNTNGTVEHKDATCTGNGVVGGTYCDVCNEGKEAAEKVIEAAGHDWGAATCTSAEKCKLCTATTGEALGHDYIVNDEGIHICSRCDKKRAVRVEIQSLGGTAAAKFTTTQNYTYNAGTTTSTTSGKQGMLYLNGWGALCGEATGIRYRVLSSDGTEIQGWRDLEQWNTMTLWSASTKNLTTQQGVDSTITNEYNFTGMIDLSAFPGATVTVEVAFVLKDAPEGSDLLIFAHATNVKNKETRTTYTNIDSINYDKNYLSGERFSGHLVFSADNAKYPTDIGYIPTDISHTGLLYIQGWGGTQGKAKAVVYRVVDANGQVLSTAAEGYTDGWQPLVQHGAYPTISEATSGAVLTNVQAKIPGAHAYNYRGYADLSEFHNQSVSVEVAFVLDNPLAYNATVTFITVENVKFVRPVGLNINSLQGYLKPSWHTEVLVFGEDYTYSGSTSNVTKPSYPTGGIATSGTEKGTLYLAGWAGTNAEATDLVFRVLDANGNVISTATEGYTDGWTNDIVKEKASSGGYYDTFGYDATATKSLQQTVDGGFAYSFRGYLNLREFAGQSVTVECALVLKDVPESQKYFTIITVEKVNVGS